MRMSGNRNISSDGNGLEILCSSDIPLDRGEYIESELVDFPIEAELDCESARSIVSSRLKTIEDEIESLVSGSRNSLNMYRVESEGSIGTSFNSMSSGRSRDSSRTRDLKLASRCVSHTSMRKSDNKNRIMSCRSLSRLSEGDRNCDAIQSYLHSINNNTLKATKALTKMTSSSLKDDSIRCLSAPTSDFVRMDKMRDCKDFVIEVEKRLVAEKSLESLKADLEKCQQEERKLKNIRAKITVLTGELNCEKQKRLIAEKSLDNLRANYQKLQLEEKKKEDLNEKYLKLVKDLKSEQERRWNSEQEVKILSDKLEESSLKIQELIGARTMAVELAHNLGEKSRSCLQKYQECMRCCESLEKERAKANDSFKLLNEKVESLQNECTEKDRRLLLLKQKLESAERIITEYNNRDPTDSPEVKSLLDKQRKSFKTALKEKEENEMALQAKCSTFEVDMNLMRSDFSNRLQEIENAKQNLNEEFKQLIKEKEREISLEKLAHEELTEVVNQCKERITELSEANKHQEIVIKCQNDTIESKNDRLSLAVQEANLNARLVEQEKAELRQENARLVSQLEKKLEEERDKLRVKEKIADDQAETIMQLKSNLVERSKELLRRSNEKSKLEKQLASERQEKENIACDVAHLRMLRDKNSMTIKDLQKQVETLKDSSLHKKHTQMLEDLEKKVQQKQAQWQLEISKITEERNQARETAQYAIDNLTTALQEQEKELIGQKNMRHKMASLIREKEEQLTAAEAKVNEFRKSNWDKSQLSDNENLRIKPSWSANRLFKQKGQNYSRIRRPTYKYKLI